MAIDKLGTPFLWPIRQPGPDGRDNTYWESARIAVRHAEQGWIKLRADLTARAYVIYRALNQEAFGEPQWPALTWREVLALAFRDRFIQTLDHPVLKKLRGEL